MVLQDAEIDNKIREQLRTADTRGTLGRLAADSGIAGGVAELRKIANSTGPLHIMDRGMLGMFLAK